MPDERGRSMRQAQEPSAGGRRGREGTGTAVEDTTTAGRRRSPAASSLAEALTAAIRQHVAQRAARFLPAQPPLASYLCERCLDAPAVLVQPAPGGGEMGVCAACVDAPQLEP
jgi:hypothetical protein